MKLTRYEQETIINFNDSTQTASIYTASPLQKNPDIARVFYRAGYIESWGRGIQKICDACKNLGTDEPKYIVHGEDIMVKFYALQSAKISDSKVPKHQNEALGEALDEALSTYLQCVIVNMRNLR